MNACHAIDACRPMKASYAINACHAMKASYAMNGGDSTNRSADAGRVLDRFAGFAALVAMLAMLAGCGGGGGGHAHDAGHGDHGQDESAHGGHGHDAGAEEFERGPHGGRLLRDGDFALEITIFERGVPPQFRLYAYRNDEPLPPNGVNATVVLTRLGGKQDRFTFTPQGDALAGSGTVVEPHSFDVLVTASEGGREHRWSYASYEGRTSMPAAVARQAGVRTEIAGPATIRSELSLMGSVVVDESRQARVRARFPGIVREVRVTLGERVTKGQVLALVEGNESMRTYPVVAPLAGIVTARETNVGDVTGEQPLFEIADLSHVWVDLHAFGPDMSRLRPGQAVRLRNTVGDGVATARVERLLPVAAAGSQSAIVRVRLPNPDGQWRPGLAVGADITLDEHEVPLAVKVTALQRFRDATVVFAQVGETYEVRMLELGRRDGEHAEVLGGLEPGTTYVTEQSFLIRADIEKSGAGHDH